MTFDDHTMVLGVDAGGSHTVCVAMFPPGVVSGRGEGGPGNVTTNRTEGARRSMRDAIGGALSGTGESHVIGLCAAVAGSTNPAAAGEALESLRDALDESGLDAARVVISLIPDAYAALVAGAQTTSGMVAVSGTGSIVWGRGPDGTTARADGWGYLLGDDGSGYALGRKALRAVMRSHDGRGEPTLLTNTVPRHFGLQSPEQLVEHAYFPPLSTAEVAALALPVCKAAELGDRVAIGLIQAAGEAIAVGVGAVAARLRFTDRPTPLVLAGGLFQSALYGHMVTRRVKNRVPEAVMSISTTEPALGAAWLALFAAGLEGPLGLGGVGLA